MPDQRQAQIIAEAVGAAMMERDRMVKRLGIRLDRIEPGHVVLSLVVDDEMLNGAGTCHGGVTFTLADTAFAFACNSHNRISVGHSASITYPNAAKVGDRLIADCREIHCKGRNGIYDCTVTNQDGQVVALFRGNSRLLQGHFVEGTK